VNELDDTDLAILRRLVADGRRSWTDLAESVDLSPPAVADRVDRLREAGVIRGFTVDVDRAQLREGVPVLVSFDLAPGAVDDVRARLVEAEAVEHLFVTAAGDLVVGARVPDGDVPAWLRRSLQADGVDDPTAAIRDYEVTLLTDAAWTPGIGGGGADATADVGFALDCAECGNTVTSEGVAARVGGDRYRFCCPSCRSRFEERYERLEAGAASADAGDDRGDLDD
jgi:DNA-binding Lrp family transcriptional regulator